MGQATSSKNRKTKSKSAKRPGRPRKSTVVLGSDEEGGNDAPGYTASFPIVLTTYEMIIRDRAHLQTLRLGIYRGRRGSPAEKLELQTYEGNQEVL